MGNTERRGLRDDCVCIPDVHKDARIEHERRKCGMECSSNLASNVRLQKGDRNSPNLKMFNLKKVMGSGNA